MDKIRLALVDDNLVLRKMLSDYLSNNGFNILLEAGNGLELLGELGNAAVLPDVCLMDSNMPKMDGNTTCIRLRADYPSIQIMAYSFFDEDDKANILRKSGAHDCISKDAGADEVRDALRSLFQSSRPESFDL
jgi:CheY-like chemotaxis protein